MSRSNYNPLVHRIALATAVVALLPIVVGALVTTMKWGMAFLDWPSSDGHPMLLYPWFRDIAQGNAGKAAEHGHRLAGIAIGLTTIALVLVTWWKERRLWVRMTATAILLAVVVQGILGGQRVVQNERLLAMLHGGFAAVVFTMMAALVLFTSRSWLALDWDKTGSTAICPSDVARLKPLAFATPLILCVQYVLGGLLRHVGTALHEHIGFGVIALLLVVATAVNGHRSRIGWLRRPAWMLAALVTLQVLLGIGAFLTRFGFASAGYVAVQQSPLQVVMSTSHTVMGMLVVMTSVVYAIRVFRIDSVHRPAGAFREGQVALGGPANPEQGGIG